MHRLSLLAALLPTLAFAEKPSPCSFTLGNGSVKAESSIQPQKLVPYWFTVSGRAEVEIKGKSLTAKLFDSAANGDHTHTLTVNLGRPLATTKPFRTGLTGTLKNLFSDAGDDALTGSFGVSVDQDGQGKPILHSLVAHNAYSFVALSCHGKGAA
jgi:hypothetical protein